MLLLLDQSTDRLREAICQKRILHPRNTRACSFKTQAMLDSWKKQRQEEEQQATTAAAVQQQHQEQQGEQPKKKGKKKRSAAMQARDTAEPLTCAVGHGDRLDQRRRGLNWPSKC
jgi:membrane carboxypeptidase/penicillin-binding protein PbpC